MRALIGSIPVPSLVVDSQARAAWVAEPDRYMYDYPCAATQRCDPPSDTNIKGGSGSSSGNSGGGGDGGGSGDGGSGSGTASPGAAVSNSCSKQVLNAPSQDPAGFFPCSKLPPSTVLDGELVWVGRNG
ncbi:MAG: hypothetical protein WDW36_006130 [Sanguina aurantia]